MAMHVPIRQLPRSSTKQTKEPKRDGMSVSMGTSRSEPNDGGDLTFGGWRRLFSEKIGAKVALVPIFGALLIILLYTAPSL